MATPPAVVVAPARPGSLTSWTGPTHREARLRKPDPDAEHGVADERDRDDSSCVAGAVAEQAVADRGEQDEERSHGRRDAERRRSEESPSPSPATRGQQ